MNANDELKVWIDGELLPKSNAKLSVYDHGLLYGDGVFEGIRIYNGRIFEAEAHARRLWDSAKAIRMTIPITQQQLIDAIYQTAKVNNFTDCYVRAVVTRGTGYLGLNPNKCPKPTVFVITDTIEMYPREMYENGMSIITSSVIRNHANSLSPRIKSLNYLNNILAKIDAVDANVPEALMLNSEGNVAECTGDNIFIVKNQTVYTPQTSDGILEGITRAAILKLCQQLKINCVEKTLQRFDLYSAEECFLTGTAAEVIAVTKLDGRVIGSGHVGATTRKLMDAFHKLVRGG